MRIFRNSIEIHIQKLVKIPSCKFQFLVAKFPSVSPFLLRADPFKGLFR